MLTVEIFKVGELETNCYLVSDEKTRHAVIIDPGKISERLKSRIQELGASNIDYILLTHGHYDHIGSANLLREKLGAKIVIGRNDSKFLRDNDLNLSSRFIDNQLTPFHPDIEAKDQDIITLGSEEIKVIETPGHTRGSVCYFADGKIFSGDTLMCEDIGRVDLPTGDYRSMMNSIKMLSDIEGNYEVYPGHGNSTTLQAEREKNIYFRKVANEF